MRSKMLGRICAAFGRTSQSELLLSFGVRKNQHLAMDPTQAFLLKEKCIAVDTNDKAIGEISKEEAHLLGPNGQLPPLHRAFSVFVFNTKNELLMQQRSEHKITFPGYYTNSCCSHPLHNCSPDETDEAYHVGIRRAARRRLQIELGIDPGSIELSDFKILTRIIYGATSDGKWGEHEVDYILFLRKDVSMKPNPNEVSRVAYVSLSGFREFQGYLEKNNILFTPWFRLILNSHLKGWWKQIDNLERIEYDPVIHRL